VAGAVWENNSARLDPTEVCHGHLGGKGPRNNF
jgi:hypothetical protein